MRSYNKLSAFVVDTDSKVKEITPDNEQYFTPKEFMYYLGTEVPAFLKTSDGRTIVCCELTQDKNDVKVNVVASLLYIHGDCDQVRGKAIICQTKFIN